MTSLMAAAITGPVIPTIPGVRTPLPEHRARSLMATSKPVRRWHVLMYLAALLLSFARMIPAVWTLVQTALMGNDKHVIRDISFKAMPATVAERIARLVRLPPNVRYAIKVITLTMGLAQHVPWQTVTTALPLLPATTVILVIT